MRPTAAAVASLNWPSGNHLSFEQPRTHQSPLGASSIYPLNLPTRLPEDPFFFYAAILGVGNVVAALLAYPLLATQLPASLESASPLMAAFAGVFTFEGVLSNTNITVFGKGVLTIDDWIEKARSTAVAAALQKHADHEQDALLKTAKSLMKLQEDQLNAHLLGSSLTADKLKEIENIATAAKADVKYYKALVFATEYPARAAAVSRSLA